MKKLAALLIFCTSISVFGQDKVSTFGFEENEPLTSKWYGYGDANYNVSIDNKLYHSGKASVSIQSKPDSKDFQPFSYSIPADFGGKKIKMTGYIKTEDVTDGYAGLWMRIDPNVGFDNMGNRQITGTTDWKKYEIELDLKPAQAKTIVFGALIAGKGTMWLDDIEVTVDGKPLLDAGPKALSPAQKDTEFDAGSNFSIESPTSQHLENLAVLGRVWGYLKYHHPAVSKGELNWDYELFRVINGIAFAKADAQRDAAILQWIESYGDIAKCDTCKKTTAEAIIKPDHRWISNSGLSEKLQQKLKEVYDNRTQGEHYYVGNVPMVGNPEFKNENAYADMPYPDAGFRLLGLFRYWNMIQYYFPYKDITDKDWATVLEEYIPEFINAEDELAYEIANIKLIGDVKDTHANLWGGNDKWQEKLGSNYPPFHVAFIEDRLLVLDYYNPEMQKELGLEVGDAIIAINGESTAAIVKRSIPFYPASNDAARFRDISGSILRSTEEALKLTIERDGQTLEKTIPLFDRKDLNYYRWYKTDKEAPSFKMLPGNIGYISLATIKRDDPAKIEKAFINCSGIIIDIRNYPSAFMPFALGQFIAPRNSDFVKFTTVDLNNPGAFHMGQTIATGKGAEPTFKGKVIVLTNELSQSQAEYTAMAFKAAPNTTVIGSTTAGADGNVSMINLPGGMRTMISGIGVFYPDGTPTQRVGIVPDMEVKPTIKGIKEGRDELLEQAVNLILRVKQ